MFRMSWRLRRWRTTTDTASSTNFNAAYHFLNPQPRDFTSGNFKSRTTPSGALPRDEDIFRTITANRKGQIMRLGATPPLAHLDRARPLDLVDYVKTLSPRFKSEQAPASIDIPTAPYATVRDVRRTWSARAGWCTRYCSAGRVTVIRQGQRTVRGDVFDDWEVPYGLSISSTGNFNLETRRPTCIALQHGLNGTPMPCSTTRFCTPRRRFLT